MAGGSIIGALRVVLGMDTAQFESAAQRAPKTAATMSSRISASFEGAARSAGTLQNALGALGGALALKELAGAAQRAFDYADAIQDLSDRTGASTKLIQEFRYAAQLSGASVEVADEALGKFAKSLGLAQSGSDQQVKLFRQLGVSSADFDTALRQTIAGIAKLPTVQQRNSTALQLMGKSAATLTGLLGQGVDGFDDLAAAAHRLGIVLGDDVIRNAGGANDKLDTLKMILDAQFANAVTQNANSIVALADGVTKLTSSLIKFMAENPRAALAVIGGLAGARAGGIGAAIGAAGGYIAGDQIARNAADQNMDLRFRAQKLRESVAAYRNTKKATAAGGLFGIRKASGDGPQDLAGAAREMRRQQALSNAAVAAAQAHRGGGGTSGVMPKVGNAEASSAASKAAAEQKRQAAEAKRNAEKAERDEERFQRELSRERGEQLRASADLAVTQEDRAAAEQKMLDEDKATRLGEIARDKDLTDQQKAQLSTLVEETAVLKSRLLHRREQEDLARQELEHQERVNADATDLLDAQAGLARTAAERRDLELQLLDLQFKQLKLAQQAIIDSPTATKLERDDAAARLVVLDKLKALAQQRTERDTAGPLGQYLDSMPRNAAELNEAYQAVAADGLKNLNDGLAEAITGSRSLTSVFSDMASSIIADLARIAVQQMIIKPLAERLFGATQSTGGGTGRGILSILGGLIGGRSGAASPFAGDGDLGPIPFVADSSGLPKLATGGFFKVGGRSGIDRNVLSVNGVPRAMVGANERVHVNPANDRGGGATVLLAVEEGALFRPTVRSEAGNVSIRTVGAAGRAQATQARQTVR